MYYYLLSICSISNLFIIIPALFTIRKCTLFTGGRGGVDLSLSKKHSLYGLAVDHPHTTNPYLWKGLNWLGSILGEVQS